MSNKNKQWSKICRTPVLNATQEDKKDIHEAICGEIHELYKKKNADYGDSFSQLRKRYPNFVCMRLFDKLNRLDTLLSPGYTPKVSDETIEDTLMDIANYCIMELTERTAERPLHVGCMEE